MFPLGTVLLPGLALPLHVFEPRYRALVEDCLAGDRPLGVVLIERGHEVGGGDTRFGVACRARIASAERFDDGRWLVVVAGTERVKIAQWLDEDPYPRAAVVPWPDPDPADPAGTTSASYDGVIGRLRAVLGLRATLNRERPPPRVDLPRDPGTGAYVAAAMAPLGPLDRLAVLSAPTVDERLDLLNALLDDQATVLRARLGESRGTGP